jgi:signal peptidase I
VKRAVAGLVVVACVGAALGYLRAWPPLATVMSASMSPTIETGDLVVMRRIDGAPRVGDVIAVPVPEGARARYGYPPEVIHRIVRIAPDGRITTKGDARDKPDPFTVRRSEVRAEVVATVPAAGRVLSFLTSTLGLVWIAGGVLLLVVLPVVDRRREAAERGQDELAAVRSDMQAVLEELVLLQASVRAAQEREREEPPRVPAPAPDDAPPPGGLLGQLERWGAAARAARRR